MRTALLLGLFVLLSACSGPSGLPADLILQNGVVWTGGDDPEIVSAVAVRGDEIVMVGTDAQVASLRGPETETVDLEGAFGMPGFIDNHTHFVDGGFKLQGVDLRSAVDEADLAERLRRKAAELPEGTWITGGDWDHEAWPSATIPNRKQIDEATPDTPVFVNRLDGHMGLANSLALQLAGVDRRTPDPPGGTIVRDENGDPAGVLKDAAMNLVAKVVPSPSGPEIDQAIEAALGEARRLGVTTVNAMVTFRELAHLDSLSRAKRLTARIYAILPLPAIDRWRPWVRHGIESSPFLQYKAVKGFMDGSLGSTTAWFYDPYLDEPGTSGLPSEMWFPEGNMEKLMRPADEEAGLQLVIHAIGDRANDQLLDLFDKISDGDPAPRRYRVEHAQHLTREAIERFGRMKVIASMQPYHAIDDGRWAEKRIGPERIQTTYAFRSLLDAGAVVTFGSDWTVAPMSPLLGIYAAVTRRTLDGKNPAGWVPEEKISVEEALRCYTANNAYAIFQEDTLGALEAGKQADIAVLSANPLEIDPVEIQNIRVLRTIVAGRTVHTAQD